MSYSNRVTVTIWQDKRRQKKNGTYPIKMQVFSNSLGRKHYSTGIDLTKEEYEKIWRLNKPSKKVKEVTEELRSLRVKAENVINRLNHFSFKLFEEQFFETKKAEGYELFSLYKVKIDRFSKLKRPGTSDWYRHSRDSIIKFLQYVRGKVPERLEFEEITVPFLEDYELFMIDEQGKSSTTVGIYVRALKAVFNTALEAGYTNHYPFGKRYYQPPDPKKVKKALSAHELDKLVNCTPRTPEQAKARDWFLLSYSFGGINLIDLLDLKNKDLEGDYLTFYRKKTQRTSEKPITIPITDFARELISKYLTNHKSENAYAFGLINEKATPKERQQTAKNTVKFINQHIKKLAKEIGINEAISYQWARHTFNTLAVQNGASLEWVQQMQGHANIKTTMNYFQGFPEEQTKDIMESLTKF